MHSEILEYLRVELDQKQGPTTLERARFQSIQPSHALVPSWSPASPLRPLPKLLWRAGVGAAVTLLVLATVGSRSLSPFDWSAHLARALQSCGQGSIPACADALVNPNVALTTPETAVIAPTIVASARKACLEFPTDFISLNGVRAGDQLLLLVAGQGYTGAASIVNSVTDSGGNTWNAIKNSGSITEDNTDYISFAVYSMRAQPAYPADVAVTINGTEGQSPYSALLIDVRGSSGISASAFDSALQDSNTSARAPVIGTPAPGELVLGLFGKYFDGETISGAEGWSMLAPSGDMGCAAAVVQYALAPTSEATDILSFQTYQTWSLAGTMVLAHQR